MEISARVETRFRGSLIKLRRVVSRTKIHGSTLNYTGGGTMLLKLVPILISHNRAVKGPALSLYFS